MDIDPDEYDRAFNPSGVRAVRLVTLELVAVLIDGTANLYRAYADERSRPEAERTAFNRDWQTCADLARRVRALKE